MKIWKLSRWAVGASAVCVLAFLVCTMLSRRAYAFGGFWSSENAVVDQAAEQVIFVDNPDSTITAVIQIKYVGPAQKFAWLIPVPGTPTVAISSSTVFQRLDALTSPQYWLEATLEGRCIPQTGAQVAIDAGSATAAAPSAPDNMAAPVVLIDQGTVGPYDYVNIEVDPSLADPAGVATDWLTANAYDLTSLDSQVLSPYLQDGLNLLAFKLSKGTDVGAIRPVTLTYDGELPMLPIRPTAVAARDDMGIQVWVIGPSQAVPANYKSLVINEALIDWQSGAKYTAGTLPSGGAGTSNLPYASKPTNYDAIVTAAANEAGGQGFVTELGAPASQFRERVWSSVDDQRWTMLSSQSYADGIDAILMANSYYRGWDGWNEAIRGSTKLPDGVSIDEFSRDPEQYRGAAKVDVAAFFQLFDASVIKPAADTAALLYRAPYLTRLYSTMSSAEMTLDPVFDYNTDLAQISNIHIAKQFVDCSSTLSQDDAPWRIELPHGGVIVGKGSGEWPVPAGSMPANLKIVELKTTGSGTVVKDNSAAIGMQLRKSAGTNGSGAAILELPHNGLTIGGTQSVTRAQTGAARSSPKSMAGNGCSVSLVGAGTRFPLASWLALAGMIFFRLRMRSGIRLWKERKKS